MKIKQKTLFVGLLLVFSVAANLLVSQIPTAYALTKTEKKACYQTWAGRTLGAAGEGEPFNEANFNKNKCSADKRGSCKIVRYSDGAVIHCQRADGKSDNGSGGWGGTVGGSDTGETGDDGTDTGGAGDDCGGVETAIIKCNADNEGGLKDNGVWALLIMAINILTAGIGIAAIGGIVYGSILYTTAGDNESQIKSAKEIIRNVIIGIILYIAMYALLQFIIPGGVFQ